MRTKLNIMNIEKIFPTNEKITVEDYPYGFKKTTAYFSVEFNFKKGFRSVFQTVNPKTGRINKPKNSTYSPIVVMYQEKETGHVKALHMSLNGIDDIIPAIDFMSLNFDLFQPKEIESICVSMLAGLKTDIYGSVAYGGADFDDIKDYYTPAIDILVAICNDSTKNIFSRISIDKAGINSKKPKDFNPFVTTLQN